jgi:hypothetical protein
MIRKAIFCLAAALVVIGGCGPKIDTESDPRKIIINLFNAMDKSDRSALAHYLDFSSLLKTNVADYALQMDSMRVFYDPEQILDDLVKGGLTNTRWGGLQRIVGDAQQGTDTALVDVSFINQGTGTQYLTKFGLRKVGGNWKIFSFNFKGGQK